MRWYTLTSLFGCHADPCIPVPALLQKSDWHARAWTEQVRAGSWLINHVLGRGLLQGLGKTLQTISLLGYLYEFKGIKGPHMVVAPKSTLGNWMRELNRFCPALKAMKFHGNQEERVRGTTRQVSPLCQCLLSRRNSWHLLKLELAS